MDSQAGEEEQLSFLLLIYKFSVLCGDNLSPRNVCQLRVAENKPMKWMMFSCPSYLSSLLLSPLLMVSVLSLVLSSTSVLSLVVALVEPSLSMVVRTHQTLQRR